MTRLGIAIPIVLLVAGELACACGSSDPGTGQRQDVLISDEAHNSGTKGFFFLPPMVPMPTFSGVFDPALSPVVQIDRINPTTSATLAPVVTFTRTTGRGSARLKTTREHYVVRWHTNRYYLDPEGTYRIRVLVDGRELGFADVDVVATKKELRNVQTNESIGLVNGKTLTIKFRIEGGTPTPPPSGDSDGDGFADDIDNCATVANPDQRDTDSSGIGDCLSGYCATLPTGNVCATPTCTDGVKNGLESDVDCAGSCPTCGNGQRCGDAFDCASASCGADRRCQPSCPDGWLDGTETGIDCGGTTCSTRCPAGETCGAGSDCLSEVCAAAVCQAPSCSDGVKNGVETDTDCGGDACAACADGLGCSTVADCQDGVCSAGSCLAPTCTDGVKNGAEREIDCGGDCPSCVAADPATVAPPLDPSTAPALAAATAFLYTGPDPIQRGVAPGTIEAHRAAVLRGRVSGREGLPLAEVGITILEHPELGRTHTRLDGGFDMAVNGGETLRVRYEKSGYIPVERQVAAPWQEFAAVPEVVMTPYDPAVTAVDLAAPDPFQVARGSTVTDADGTRQATLLFAEGTSATLVLPGGATRPLSSLHVRATEYTTGNGGLAAMPGPLPPTSAYTYAVELSVDEAVAAGASEVRFSRPVVLYVDNFLAFPTGTTAPVGGWDPGRGVWVPTESGRVVRILDTVGLATLDADGDGAADDAAALSALGITDAERERLASLYTTGTSLWRVRIPHFSGWDVNWGFSPPPDAVLPDEAVVAAEDIEEETCPVCNVDAENQVLDEAFPVPGTGLSMHYRSDRVPGRTAAGNHLGIKVSGASVPASLERIALEVEVAGQQLRRELPPLADQTVQLTWDGADAYGRPWRGSGPVTARVGYVYRGVYQETARFGYNGNGQISGNITRREVTLWQTTRAEVRPWDARGQGFGGWTLGVHHAYDPAGRTLYLGNGQRRSAGAMERVITTVAGNGAQGYAGDGGRATEASLDRPTHLRVDAQGNLYLLDGPQGQQRVRRVGPDGTIQTVPWVGSPFCPPGFTPRTNTVSGEPACDAQWPLGWLWGSTGEVEVDAWGYAYHAWDRLGPDGTATRLPWNTFLATNNGNPNATAIDAQGSVYLAQGGFESVGFVLAGCGWRSLGQVLRLSPDGQTTVVIPGGWDGMTVFDPSDLTVDATGNLYVVDSGRNRILMRAPDGTITRVAGTGLPGFAGDGGPASRADLSLWRDSHCNYDETKAYLPGITVDAAGNLYIADFYNQRVRKVHSPFPGFAGAGDIVVPSPDGGLAYVFSSVGRHLRTVDTLTGALVHAFAYGAGGRLESITDGDGNLVQIERDAGGAPTAIVAPGGQRTALATDAEGWLTGVTDPGGHRLAMDYTADGLLTSLTDPKGQSETFAYGADGRLQRLDDRGGGFLTLVRTGATQAFQVALRTALGRERTQAVDHPAAGGRQRVITAPDGTRMSSAVTADRVHTTTAPNGTTARVEEGPDPRFGMLAPLARTTIVTTPGGLRLAVVADRTVTLADPSDPLSLSSETRTARMNGKTYTSTFDRPTMTVTDVSPAGRQSRARLDDRGRVLETQLDLLEPALYTYDAVGRIVSVGQGGRTATFAYDARNRLASVTDALGRTHGFAYDEADRLIAETLPDGRAVAYAYDANGNLVSLVPPGRPAHAFAHTARDQVGTYAPPDLGPGEETTRYGYDADGQLVELTRPDGAAIDYLYDAAGRPALVAHADGTVAFAYEAGTARLASLDADGETLAFAYDGTLVLGETWGGTIAGSVTRGYDDDRAVTAEHVNGVAEVIYTYDPDGLVITAGTLSITRDAGTGLPLSATLGRVSDDREYDAFADAIGYTTRLDDSVLFAETSARDDLGRIIAKVVTRGGATRTRSFTYDPSGRLTDVAEDGVAVARYTYDHNGNRLSGPTDAEQGVYDAQDRLLAFGDRTYTYTAAGELDSRTDAAGTTRYHYDALGALRWVELPDGTRLDYVIDATGRRIGKRVNGVLVQGFLYADGLRVAAELDGAGALVSRFVYAGASLPEYMIRGGSTYRILGDHLGSPRLVVDVVTGEVVQEMDHDEFGRVRLDTNPGFQPFGFAGGLYDVDAGLVRLGARDYDADAGRWTAKDPTGFAGGDTGLYGYVSADPVNFVDPEGRQSQNAAASIERFRTLTRNLVADLVARGERAKGGGLRSNLWRLWDGKVRNCYEQADAFWDLLNTNPRAFEGWTRHGISLPIGHPDARGGHTFVLLRSQDGQASVKVDVWSGREGNVELVDNSQAQRWIEDSKKRNVWDKIGDLPWVRGK